MVPNILTRRAGIALIDHKGGPCATFSDVTRGLFYGLKEKRITTYGAIKSVEGILGKLYEDGYKKPPNMENFSLLSDSKINEIFSHAGSYLGTSKQHINKEVAAEMVKQFKKFDIRYYFPIGGDSTSGISRDIIEVASDMNYEFTLIQSIKTIDNDCAPKDNYLVNNIGWGSSVRYAALRAVELTRDCESSPGIYVIFSMGRDSGFLSMGYKLLVDGMYVYLPEVNFSEDFLIGDIQHLLSKKGMAVVVIGEGAQTDGKLVSQIYCEKNSIKYEKEENMDRISSRDNTKYQNALIDGLLKKHFPKTRMVIMPPNYAIRAPIEESEIDAHESEFVGREAVFYALNEKGFEKGSVLSGAVATVREAIGSIYRVHTEIFDVNKIAGNRRRVPKCFTTTHGKEISDLGMEYMGPVAGLGLREKYGDKFYLLPNSFDLDSFCIPHPERKPQDIKTTTQTKP